MPSLYNATSDNSQPIATLDDLRSALPDTPVIPSIYALDGVANFSIQVIYGWPRHNEAEVKVFTADGIEGEVFDTFDAATNRFLAIAHSKLQP